MQNWQRMSVFGLVAVIVAAGLVFALAGRPQPGPATAESAEAASGETPAWAQIELTDVRTGETFTLADFAGRTVLVHGMATWCAPCTAAQMNLRDNVVPQLAGEDYAFVSVSVETNLTHAQLAAYADDNGFDWTFAVLSPEMLAELTREFGAGMSTPPLRPHFIIGPAGDFSDLLRGEPRPADLIADLQAFNS